MYSSIKILFLPLLFFISFYSDAQTDHINKTRKSLRAFFAIAYNDIYNKTIPSTLLEKYIGVSYGFGDKAAIKDMIIKELLFTKPQKNDFSGFWDTLNTNNSDLHKLPAISIDIREVPLKLYLMVLMLNSIDSPNKSFYEIALPGESWSKSVSPHKPHFDPGDEERYIIDYAKNIQWAIQYPDETLPYSKRIMDGYIFWHNKDTSIQLIDFYDFVMQKFLKLKPFLEKNMPQPLNHYISSFDQNRSAIPSIKQIHENPESFIENVFQNLLNRKPTSLELLEFTDMYKTDNNLSGEILYYTIMTSDGYAYY